MMLAGDSSTRRTARSLALNDGTGGSDEPSVVYQTLPFGNGAYILILRRIPSAVHDTRMARGEIAEIGKYRILGQIGEGAMGVVYRALDPVLNRAVAIKVMSDALARDTDLRGRFLREAQSAGSLQHPNVITIYDFGEVDGHPFIAMEFVEGADLNEILEKKTPLTLVQKLDVLIDVLNGLAYAHKRGIVHRDIKPANIRIDEEGRARVMDFGIAHLSSSSLTRTGVMVGTPAYMSPEQIVGGEVSPASDIFAVGAVTYELLTGVQAFRGESLQTVMYKIVSAPTPELRMNATGPSTDKGTIVAKALNAIVMKALDKDADRRYETALDMANALGDVRLRLLDDDDPIRTTSLRATVAKAMANTEENKARARRNRVAMFAGAAALVVVAVTAVMYLSRRSGPTLAVAPATSAPTPPPQVPAPVEAASPLPQVAAAPAMIIPPAVTTPGKTSDANVSRSRELAALQALQSTALEVRRRAVEAGASAEQLSSGDAQNRTANALALNGKSAEAGDHFNQATAQWTTAERNARAARVQVAQAPRTPAVDVARPQAPVPSPMQSQGATVQQASVVPQSPPPAASSPAADIAAAVTAYARALESRDVSAVRRAYPGITSAQEKGWEQFFGTLRSLRVSLTTKGLEVNGNSADAKLAGTYDYVTDGGKAAQQPVAFDAVFRRDGSTWQLMSVH